MTQDEIIEMAREVGDLVVDARGRMDFSFDEYGLVAFAKLVAAKEREALAQPKQKPEKEVTITCSCGDKFYIPLDELIKQLQEDKSQEFPKRFDTHPSPPQRKPLTDEMLALLKRYRKETPLGHQPHMIAHLADEVISKYEAAHGIKE